MAFVAVLARIPGHDGTPVGHVYKPYMVLCYKILQTVFARVGPMNERCGASVFPASTVCDSDVTGTRIICSRINIYTAITKHPCSYTFTFPTAAPVKWQYEWHGHLQPEIIHTHTRNITRRNYYYATVIRLTSSYYKLAHTLLYRQSLFIMKTIQHPQVRPVGKEPISSERRPMAHTVNKCFKRLRVNI